MDTVIVDATVLTFADGSPGIIEDGAVGIDGDEIAYVGPAAEFDAAGGGTAPTGGSDQWWIIA